jgi:hypothetical protein
LRRSNIHVQTSSRTLASSSSGEVEEDEKYPRIAKEEREGADYIRVLAG